MFFMGKQPGRVPQTNSGELRCDLSRLLKRWGKEGRRGRKRRWRRGKRREGRGRGRGEVEEEEEKEGEEGERAEG